MSFADVVRRTWDENRLFSVLFELTYRCNLDCFFCYNDVGLKGRPLSRERLFSALAELAEMEVFTVTFSGGEPLAHPDFLALGRRARELGFVVKVKTNGHAFRGDLARRVREEVDPYMIETSLHGATAGTHDRQTRVPGSFERLLANLGEMKALGFRVKVNAPMTAWNEHEIDAIFDLTDRLGVAVQVDPEITVKDDGDREPLSIAPSRDGMERLFRLQRVRAARAGAADPTSPRPTEDDDLPAPGAGKHCGAGSSTLAVDPYGNVYPCVSWRVPAGNLHETTFRAIWNGSSELETVRSTTVAVKSRLRTVPGAPGMAFCPGAARAASGDPLAILPRHENRGAAFLAASGPALPSRP